VDEWIVRRIVYQWACVITVRRKSFGEYTSFDEYMKLCSVEWVLKYGNDSRLHMWDTTDAVCLAGTPQDAILQAVTFSDYYSGHVLKGGVGCTPFSWGFSSPLFAARVTDTDYMEAAHIFSSQKELVDKDKDPAVLNVTDKGTKCSDVSLEYGQKFLTPAFRRRGEQHLPLQSVLVNTVAHDRAMNERMVLRPCSFGFCKRKLNLNFNMEVADMIRMNINFRCNFIFKPLYTKTLREWANASLSS
jgi:hypothetical protein